ncbi:fungal-specific transcription factor domain-containing protein [Aspergillus avenaceus]|uniref:Fungal-specific transcription factor domain-containing protein n=1 Tax=Aspergillus avenaceus TaxID=36643 RepID=A0A5N6TLH7_ASPAV|nr:fungal-specific transcription factor domain-containing protein [Aspergillus avenaceus]
MLMVEECVYAQPRRRKRSSPQSDRIAHLEKRLKAVEESCRQHSPGTTVPSIEHPSDATVDTSDSTKENSDASVSVAHTGEQSANVRTHPRLESQGEARFSHSAAHMDFIRRLKNELGDWPGADAENRVRGRDIPAPKFFPVGNNSPQRHSLSLPSQEQARYLVEAAFNAHFLHNFIHRPSFESTFALLFTLDISDYGEDEYKHLGLLFALMAVGSIFIEREPNTREYVDPKGDEYFETCHTLVDLLGCDDLVTLQAILYMNIYLLYTARVSSTFSALSYTFSLALRMRLHLPSHTDNKVVQETKKRLFWTTRHILACISITGGLPMPIGADDLDLEYPSEENDGTGVTTDGLHNFNGWNPVTASVACFRLHHILGHIVKRLYPSKGLKEAQGEGSLRHLVSSETMAELEDELQSWLASLPPNYHLGSHMQAPNIERTKFELCMSYAHAQIYLYRPFLHYLTTSTSAQAGAQDHFPTYASKCVDASCTIIRLAQDMYHRGLFPGVQWDIANVILAASLTMLYMALAKKGPSIQQMALTELNAAREIMILLEPYSKLAKRISTAVKLLTSTILPHPGDYHPTTHTDTIETRTRYQVNNPQMAALAHSTTSSYPDSCPELFFTPQGQSPSFIPVTMHKEGSGVHPRPGNRPGPDIHTKNTSDTAAFTKASRPSDTLLPTPSTQGLFSMPLTSDNTSGSPVDSTFPHDIGINGGYYGYPIDATGPIDFSDMIEDLFTSGGVL